MLKRATNTGDNSSSSSGVLSDSDYESTPLIRQQTSVLTEVSTEDLKDPYSAVYIIFMLLGMAALMPYNMFITASNYFEYKLRNVDNDTITTPLQEKFESYFTTCSTVALLVMILGNTVLVRVISHTQRLTWSLALVILAMLPSIVMVKLDTDSWQELFFGLTLVNIVVLNIFSAVLQGGTFGVAGMLPPVYSQAAMAGQAVSGVFSALLEIICLALFDNEENSALLYFIIAESLLVVSLIGSVFLNYIPFYVVYTSKTSQSLTTPSERAVAGSLFAETLHVFKKTIWHGFAVGLVFFISLVVFPNYMNSIKPLPGFPTKYWDPVFVFLLFNVGDLIGRVMAGVVKVPSGPIGIVGLSLLRLAFLPLYLFTNYQPRHHGLPVWFGSAWYGIVFNALLAFSNGYVGSLAMMYGPTTLTRKDLQEQAGTILTFFLSIGLATGSAMSFLYIEIP